MQNRQVPAERDFVDDAPAIRAVQIRRPVEAVVGPQALDQIVAGEAVRDVEGAEDRDVSRWSRLEDRAVTVRAAAAEGRSIEIAVAAQDQRTGIIQFFAMEV